MTAAAGGEARLADGKRRLAAAVQRHRATIIDLSHAIHADPEPAFQEVHAAARVAALLRQQGFAVDAPAGRLATAVRGTMAGGAGSDGPSIGVLAEYDALPGLGHGCGHNTMAASGVGAALALAELAAEVRGRIVFLGTPAEEAGSGKQWMLDDGLFDGLDAALLYHPGDRDEVGCELLACEDVEVTFTGLQAHAASDPWMGRNALDALVLLFTSIGLWRQQLPQHARVHGIITEGGTAANIIPARTVGRFMIRSTDQVYHEAMRDRFRDLAAAAALATATTVEVSFSSGSTVMKDNQVLGGLFRANLAAAGRRDEGPEPGRIGSSDMGNVSLRLPTIHPTLAICEAGVPGHSTRFRDAAVTSLADETTLLAATVVAQTAWDLLVVPDLVEAAWREFRGS